jgi:hypothetical protein
MELTTVEHNLIIFSKLEPNQKITVDSNNRCRVDSRYLRGFFSKTDWVFGSTSSRHATYDIIKLTYDTLKYHPNAQSINSDLINQSLENLLQKLQVTYQIDLPEFCRLSTLIKDFQTFYNNRPDILSLLVTPSETSLENTEHSVSTPIIYSENEENIESDHIDPEIVDKRINLPPPPEPERSVSMKARLSQLPQGGPVFVHQRENSFGSKSSSKSHKHHVIDIPQQDPEIVLTVITQNSPKGRVSESKPAQIEKNSVDHEIDAKSDRRAQIDDRRAQIDDRRAQIDDHRQDINDLRVDNSESNFRIQTMKCFEALFSRLCLWCCTCSKIEKEQ